MSKYARKANSPYNKYDLYENNEKIGDSTMYYGKFHTDRETDDLHRERLENRGYRIREKRGNFIGGKMKIVKAKIKRAKFITNKITKPPDGRKIKLPV